MTKPIRFGVLGAANFALNHMAPAIHRAKGAEFAALATSSEAKAVPFQEFCPNLAVYTDYQELLNTPDIDAVYIPLPNNLHVEWSKKALKAGKHVLCEKPLALEAGEFDDLIALRDERGLLAAEAFMITHHPQWIEARKQIANGAIGELRHVSANFCYNNETDVKNIRNLPEYGGGALRDIGVYILGSTLFATEAKTAEVLDVRMRKENDVDVFTNIFARMDGFTYSGMVSMRLTSHQEVVFFGDRGKLIVKTPFNANVYAEAQLHITNDSGEQVIRYPGVEQYALQVENFCKSVMTGADYPWSLEDAKKTQLLMDDVFQKSTDV
ncbi:MULTISPECIES: Gfo/Idh/MocA family protein [Halocynthiibacter]|uniref:Gfo/Idh/MocA family oxidoreductase n=1 Tax=Halocynthiibacter halioticoli TaxID=2986804 RepID=A0AAE3IZ02_9RHOB|nr:MULTISPECIES: Gfo/Idh/MocA family oxidoreductase [Halocynthiibacter]MCV6824917.1 Gfo/Idh/MocA family oxidoreductase [Halocynthiibacter halioticoli]MCW4057918.1 Gfo/Idh/MocA family oxidoreductase [Halocynthiibacter sp. SDUM655004]